MGWGRQGIAIAASVLVALISFWRNTAALKGFHAEKDEQFRRAHVIFKQTIGNKHMEMVDTKDVNDRERLMILDRSTVPPTLAAELYLLSQREMKRVNRKYGVKPPKRPMSSHHPSPSSRRQSAPGKGGKSRQRRVESSSTLYRFHFTNFTEELGALLDPLALAGLLEPGQTSDWRAGVRQASSGPASAPTPPHRRAPCTASEVARGEPRCQREEESETVSSDPEAGQDGGPESSGTGKVHSKPEQVEVQADGSVKKEDWED